MLRSFRAVEESHFNKSTTSTISNSTTSTPSTTTTTTSTSIKTTISTTTATKTTRTTKTTSTTEALQTSTAGRPAVNSSSGLVGFLDLRRTMLVLVFVVICVFYCKGRVARTRSPQIQFLAPTTWIPIQREAELPIVYSLDTRPARASHDDGTVIALRHYKLVLHSET
jgi:hypothetical protein